MQFNSLRGGNAGDYAAAGKTVANSAAKSFAIQRKTGPDYGGLSQVAMKTSSEEKIAAIKASAKVAKAGIDAYSDVTKMGQKVAVVNDKIDRFKKQKMAGSLAAIGKIAGAGFLSATDNTKGRERPKADYTSINEGYKQKRDALLSDYNSSNDSDTTTSTDTPKKVDSGASTTPTTSTTGEGMSDGWARWSKVIKSGEGTLGDKGYTTMFTGAQFSDFSKHPELLQSGGGHRSDAAGAYQFLSTTYNPAAKKLGITDFTPASQEKVGKYLAQQRGLRADTVFTDKASFLKELDKIAPEWASMPTVATGTSYYGQGGLTPDEAWRIYNGG